tara:strand:+ start:311 stop:2149 length:1839 start_codon:yes stop_codon:yes gene_type:complete
MPNINALTKNVRDLLDNKKYSIEYYQREYRWGEEQIVELLTDLEDKFFEDYENGHQRNKVKSYPPYFLGSIILVEKNNQTFVIDGQQRLTSLTLLLIYIYKEFGEDEQRTNLLNLIRSDTFGEKNFNLNIDDRTECLEKLLDQGLYETREDDNESVKNLVERYEDIVNNFSDELKNVLPLFADWLINKVFFVEIAAQNDQDAYNIFETMNDRGLSLSSSEMLKGYLLSQIELDDKRTIANNKWKKIVIKLKNEDKDHEEEFAKSLLRARYARDIRERKRGAVKKDFDLIGTEFHRWVRDNKDLLGLTNPEEFHNFINDKYEKYSEIYLNILKYSKKFDKKYETIFFNAHNYLTLQNTILLAPIKSEDNSEIIDKKIRMVARYLDIFLARRIVNYKTIDRNTLEVNLFNLIKNIREQEIKGLNNILINELDKQPEKITTITNFKLSTQFKRKVRYLLARFTYFIESETNEAGADFGKYIRIKYEKKPFEIEHIWSHKYDHYKNIFDNEDEFREKRESLGALVLVPRGENQSFGDKHYREKVQFYGRGNILTKSLTNLCYSNNPSFTSFIKDNNLPFKPYDDFNLESLNERTELYKKLSELIWSTSQIEKEMNN